MHLLKTFKTKLLFNLQASKTTVNENWEPERMQNVYFQNNYVNVLFLDNSIVTWMTYSKVIFVLFIPFTSLCILIEVLVPSSGKVVELQPTEAISQTKKLHSVALSWLKKITPSIQPRYSEHRGHLFLVKRRSNVFPVKMELSLQPEQNPSKFYG